MVLWVKTEKEDSACCFEILNIDVILLGIVSRKQAGLWGVDVVSLCTLDPSWSAGITTQPLHGGSGKLCWGKLQVKVSCGLWFSYHALPGKGCYSRVLGVHCGSSSSEKKTAMQHLAMQHLAGYVDASPWGYGLRGDTSAVGDQRGKGAPARSQNCGHSDTWLKSQPHAADPMTRAFCPGCHVISSL